MKRTTFLTALLVTAFSLPAFAQDAAPAAAPAEGAKRHIAAEGDKGPRRHGDFLAKLDTNKDGAVDKAEFVADAEAKFTKLDADGDGKVTADEFKALREKMRAEHGDRKKAGEGAKFP